MWQAEEELVVAAPREDVWAVVADVEGHVQLAGSGEVRAIRMGGPVAVGTEFEGDVATGEVGSFVSRNVIEAADQPHRLAWVSYPPLDEGETPDHQIEVHWAFELFAEAEGTRVVHSFRVPPPRAGAAELGAFLERTDRLATVAIGMRRTLDNLKAAVEARALGTSSG